MSNDVFAQIMDMAYPLWERMGPDSMPKLVRCSQRAHDELFAGMRGERPYTQCLIDRAEIESDLGTFRVEADSAMAYGTMALVMEEEAQA